MAVEFESKELITLIEMMSKVSIVMIEMNTAMINLTNTFTDIIQKIERKNGLIDN